MQNWPSWPQDELPPHVRQAQSYESGAHRRHEINDALIRSRGHSARGGARIFWNASDTFGPEMVRL